MCLPLITINISDKPSKTRSKKTVILSLDLRSSIFGMVFGAGVVLTSAANLDFNCTILQDACTAEHDEEVRHVLMEKVFSHQATVLTVDEFIVKQN